MSSLWQKISSPKTTDEAASNDALFRQRVLDDLAQLKAMMQGTSLGSRSPQLATNTATNTVPTETSKIATPLSAPARPQKVQKREVLDRYNLPGGVMISLNVKTQAKTAAVLKSELEKRGVDCWVCVDLGGGDDYRDEIVRAVKRCHFFICLINDAWAKSGECKDEFSLAKRLNLTSHERGRTTTEEQRLPILVPVAFPDLLWDKYEHVELLAANTNFILCNTDIVEDGSHPLVNDILCALTPYHTDLTLEASNKTAPKVEASIADQTRFFEPYTTPLHEKYLGTISYYQKPGPNFRLLLHEEMCMTIERDDETDTHVKVRAEVSFTLLRIEIEINNKKYTLETLPSLTGSDSLRDYCNNLLTGVAYGGENMAGEFDKATGVLSLENVGVTGTACPTWRRLTACQNGMALVGIGGNYTVEMNPKSAHDVRSVTATRLVAF